MSISSSPHAKLSSLAVSTLVLATVLACSGTSDGPTSITRPSFDGDVPPPITTTRSKICKYGPYGTYTFEIISDAPLSGQLLVSNPFTVTIDNEWGTCVFIHESGAATDNFVVRETVPAGMHVERILRGTFGDGCFVDPAFCQINYFNTNEVAMSPTPTIGFYAYFYNANDDTPPPPPAGEGCTPGYWKNHLDSWTGYSTGADFDATFGVNLFSPNITLQQALNLGGGGAARIARHATAALLNAAHSGVASGATTADIIAMVQAVAASGDFEGTGNILEAMNEQGCPLN